MLYGFDIGGTKIEFAAFDHQLNCCARKRVPTPTNDYFVLLDTIRSIVAEYDTQFGVKGSVGLGIPGMENTVDGKILTVNIPAASNRTLRKDLEEKLQRGVQIENDANCFAVSEAWDEEFRDSPSVLGLIIGTGFGGGLVYKGSIFRGANHLAGEFGHMRLSIDAWFTLGVKAPLFDCGCGKSGCLDNYLSGRGFEALYEHYFTRKKTAQEIIKDFYRGEECAIEHVDRFIEVMAISFANIFTANDPHIVVLGGGLSNFDHLYQELPKRVKRYLIDVAHCPRIVKAKHGDSGGVRGAAFLNIKE
jgi:N-acetylglucosamine kinase